MESTRLVIILVMIVIYQVLPSCNKQVPEENRTVSHSAQVSEDLEEMPAMNLGIIEIDTFEMQFEDKLHTILPIMRFIPHIDNRGIFASNGSEVLHYTFDGQLVKRTTVPIKNCSESVFGLENSNMVLGNREGEIIILDGSLLSVKYVAIPEIQFSNSPIILVFHDEFIYTSGLTMAVISNDGVVEKLTSYPFMVNGNMFPVKNTLSTFIIGEKKQKYSSLYCYNLNLEQVWTLDIKGNSLNPKVSLDSNSTNVFVTSGYSINNISANGILNQKYDLSSYFTNVVYPITILNPAKILAVSSGKNEFVILKDEDSESVSTNGANIQFLLQLLDSYFIAISPSGSVTLVSYAGEVLDSCLLTNSIMSMYSYPVVFENRIYLIDSAYNLNTIYLDAEI